MKKVKLPKELLKLKNLGVKYSPQILTGIGIAGLVTTAVLTGKATVKAVKVIEEEKEESQEEMTAKDIVRVSWRYYVPAVATGVVSCLCIFEANSVSTKRTAALATAYEIAKTGIREYKDAVIETVGEEKEHAIRGKLNEKRLEKDPIQSKQVIFTDKSETKCYDPWSGRYFECSIDKIDKAINKLNRDMMMDMSGYVALNDFYDEIGLERTDSGRILGWNISDGIIKLYIDSKIVNEDTPVAVIDFEVAPTWGFDKNY